MDEAAEGIRDRLVNNGIRLDTRVSADIGSFIADERRVRQILYNLLSNAIGFSPAGATVRLTAERTPAAVIFSVTDQGPGIPADKREEVFQPFARLTQKRERRGTGLGLAVVRRYAGLLVLASVPADRRHTLVTAADDRGFVFDIRLQGEDETVFLSYARH